MSKITLSRIKALVRQWKAKRKLKNSGYGSWAIYRHNRDTDVFKYASKVSEFYKGYDFTYCCDNQIPSGHYAYKLLYDNGPGGYRYGHDEIRDWCEKNVRFKWRVDVHRVYKQTGIGLDGSTDEDWWFNDIGGSDYIWFAFKDEQDYFKFLLVWG